MTLKAKTEEEQDMLPNTLAKRSKQRLLINLYSK